MSSDSSKPEASAPKTPTINPPWGPWTGLVGALGIYGLVQVSLVLGVIAIGLKPDDIGSLDSIFIALASGILITAMCWLFALQGRQPASLSLGWIKTKESIAVPVLIAFGVYIVASTLLAWLVSQIFTGFDVDQTQDIGIDVLNGWWQYALAFLLLVVVTPIAEETLFRGIIFAGWRQYGFWPAALVSAVLFGLAHGQPNVALATGVLGILLAWTYEKTGSLYAPVALHALKNVVAFAFIYVWAI